MKGFRFYEELADKNRKAERSLGNVAAVCYELGRNPVGGAWEGLAALYDEPNSPVCWTGISQRFLTENCKRIPEARAREIHPRLFERLDDA